MNSLNPLPALIQPLGLSVVNVTRPTENVLITRYALDAVVIRKPNPVWSYPVRSYPTRSDPIRPDPVRPDPTRSFRSENNGTGGRRHSGRRLWGLPPGSADGQTTHLSGAILVSSVTETMFPMLEQIKSSYSGSSASATVSNNVFAV